jgi:SH3-like domain-containing protein
MNWKRFIFIGMLCPFFIFHSNAAAEMVSVKGEDINMRSGPGTAFSVQYTLGSGMPLDVIKRSRDWLNVRDFEGDTGWVHKKTIGSTPHVVVKGNRNSDVKINIRSGPGIENEIVATAAYGVVFRKLGEKDEWVHVEHAKGVEGWVYCNLLWGF